MRLPMLRIVVLAVAIEALAIGILVVLVAIFGPRDRARLLQFA
jgi:hypothetical protein